MLKPQIYSLNRLSIILLLFILAGCSTREPEHAIRLTFVNEAESQSRARALAVIADRLEYFGVHIEEVSEREGVLKFRGDIDSEVIRELALSRGDVRIVPAKENPNIYWLLDSINRHMGQLRYEEAKASTLEEVDPHSIDLVDEQKDFEDANPLYSVMLPAIMKTEEGLYVPGPGATVGYAEISDTANVNTLLKSYRPWFAQNNCEPHWGKYPFDEEQRRLQLFLLNTHPEVMTFALSELVEIVKVMDHGNEFELAVALDEKGAQLNERFSTVYFGKSVALLLDESVISAPRMETQVVGDQLSVTGTFAGLASIQIVAACLTSGTVEVEIEDVTVW